MSDDFQFFPAGAKLSYTVDFSAELTGGASLASVVWSITPQSGSPLAPALTGQSDNLSEAQSTIFVAGVAHGQTCLLQALGTTSVGDEIPKDIAVVGFNG